MTSPKIDTIIVFSPGNILSGGVNSLHNLCMALCKNNYEASMHYINPIDSILNDIQITSYNNIHTKEVIDIESNLIIVPETMVAQFDQYPKSAKMIYWLGLNYFFKNLTWRFPFNLKPFRKMISCRSYSGYSSGIIESKKRKLNEFAKSHLDIWDEQIIHLSNSHFVAQYCRDKGSPNTFVLHNPIRQEFYDFKTDFQNREKIILFGPKTPNRIIRKLKQKLPDFSIIRLKKLKLAEVFDLMSKAMIFAEFGNYSGRDRMPREAAMLGCIIFMNTRGTAALEEDYNTPRKYCITDSNENLSFIIEQLSQCAENYNQYYADFNDFREQLISENKNFLSKTDEVFREICFKASK